MRAVLLSLAALGLLLTLTAVPGVYTIDENNYLSTVVAARHGAVSLPGTQGLPASFELYWFDPFPRGQSAPRSPAPTVAPPLYALFALPFSLLGWRGLVGLNTLAFLVCAWLVFVYASAGATHRSTAWLALGAFTLGAFNLGYAQDVWPHMLSVALTLGGLYCLSRLRAGAGAWSGALGGALLGLAVGVRYQNIALAGFAGVGLVLLAERRARAVGSFLSGLLFPLLACSFINHLRTGSWHPFNKAPGYTQLSGATLTSKAQLESLGTLWAKLVDFSAHPPIVGVPLGPVPAGEVASWGWNPSLLGAFLWHGGMKKALLQSSPWILLALIVMAFAWRGLEGMAEAQRRELKAMSLVTAGMLAVIAAGGYSRQDGLCFNQRYLLEVVPLACIALAWGVERLRPGALPLLAGMGLSGGLAAGALLSEPGSFFRTLLLLKAPLVLGGLLGLSWLLARRRIAFVRPTAMLLGACLMWALAIHLGDDLPPNRRLRAYNLEQTQLYSRLIEGPSALIAFGATKDAAGPLLLSKDLVIVDPLVDGGADTPLLVEGLLNSGRRVYLDLSRFPHPLFEELQRRFLVSVVAPGRDPIVELLRKV